MTISKPALGRLERVQVRDYWASEASDFTPWLAQAENIVLLGEAIGLDLEVESVEKNVGPFRADILCRDTATDNYVLIENQLEWTDHRHLGQLMTYAAGLEAVTIVWVAARFTDEHRAALDWLNRITATDFNFFGLEIELWRIGDSPLAPKFNVASQPNDWSRTVKETAAAAQAVTLTETQQLHLAFWGQLRQHMQDHGSPVQFGKPTTSHWKYLGLGRTHVGLVIYNNRNEKRSGVYFDAWGTDTWPYLDLVKQHYGEAIEQTFPSAKWLPDATPKESRILIERQSDLGSTGTWPELIGWFASTIEAAVKLFRPIVKNLVPPAEAATAAGGGSVDGLVAVEGESPAPPAPDGDAGL